MVIKGIKQLFFGRPLPFDESISNVYVKDTRIMVAQITHINGDFYIKPLLTGLRIPKKPLRSYQEVLDLLVKSYNNYITQFLIYG